MPLAGGRPFDARAPSDCIELDFKTRGGKKHMLLMLDVATGGLRVKGFKHKHEVGEYFDEYIVEESLHKREIRVTVGADGDGAMSLIKNAARKRGVAFLPIPPYSPHLNPVEGAVNIFKQAVTSVLLSACTDWASRCVYGLPTVGQVRAR